MTQKIYMITRPNVICDFALMVGESIPDVQKNFFNLFYGGKSVYINVSELGILTDNDTGIIVATNMPLYKEPNDLLRYQPEGITERCKELELSVKELKLEKEFMDKLFKAKVRETELLNIINDLVSRDTL